MDSLVLKLDLGEFIEEFKLFLAREKPLFIEGDRDLHLKFIKKIDEVEFTPPKEVKNLDTALMVLQKQGILKVDEIYEFIKIIGYFIYLKKVAFQEPVSNWLSKIEIPAEILEVVNYFDNEGRLKDEIDERFLSINSGLKRTKEQIKDTLRSILGSSKLSSYLVDTQIHYIDEHETLLVRGGFSKALKASVVGRSSGGYFYVLPDATSSLKERQSQLLTQKREVVYEYEKRISSTFTKFLKFLKFINREFDRFDHYQARVLFAKSKELEFVKPTNKKEILLKSFSHPAIKEPKPISLDFSKKVLMITGVNAGGKTMLLKSILSAVFLAKYLLPMKIDAKNSSIANFKEIKTIIDDPQNVKNDISTFAGRMREFSKLFCKDSYIIGVDEIELGTDSDEAAILFSALLKELIKKDIKIVITTHHKRLAAIMAKEDEVELLAALYDEKIQRPAFEFLQGTIGKSYAFETAQRYGIPSNILKKARELYGEDRENLNELIQKNIDLELKLKQDLKEIDLKKEKIAKLESSLTEQKDNLHKELERERSRLQASYNIAIELAKSAAKEGDKREIHRKLNQASKSLKEAKKLKPAQQKKREFKVGDRVKYQNTKGVILSLKKSEAMIESNGMKLRVPLSSLSHSNHPVKLKAPKAKAKITVQKPSTGSVQLDLHGLRAEEAIEKLDKYISDVLIAGYDEVLIYHGVGTGKLAYAVKEFLKSHPSIKSFSDAPANMGGMGATVVKL